MAMPMPDNQFVCVIFRIRRRPWLIARTRQRRLHLPFNHRLNKARTFVRRTFSTESNQLSKSLSSATSPAAFVISVETTRKLRHLQIPTTLATAPSISFFVSHYSLVRVDLEHCGGRNDQGEPYQIEKLQFARLDLHHSTFMQSQRHGREIGNTLESDRY